MATTTGTTRATTTGSGWCAAESETAGLFSLREIWDAYTACRRRKRGTRDAQRYDQQLLDHLIDTRQALAAGHWRPHHATWFVTLRPKAREVHCAPFAERVVHHWLVPRLEAAFEPAGRRLWRQGPNGVALDLHREPREALRATLASYLGHARHASSWRLSHRVFARHPWLYTLFLLVDGLRLQPRWEPPSVTGLRGQWRWFARQWPEALVLVQTGHRFEVYDAQAEALAGWLRAPLDPAPRRPFVAALSRPLKRLRGLRRYLRKLEVAHLFIAEEGHLPGGLKRRVLRLAWWPRKLDLPPWQPTQGVQS